MPTLALSALLEISQAETASVIADVKSPSAGGVRDPSHSTVIKITVLHRDHTCVHKHVCLRTLVWVCKWRQEPLNL